MARLPSGGDCSDDDLLINSGDLGELTYYKGPAEWLKGVEAQLDQARELLLDGAAHGSGPGLLKAVCDTSEAEAEQINRVLDGLWEECLAVLAFKEFVRILGICDRGQRCDLDIDWFGEEDLYGTIGGS